MPGQAWLSSSALLLHGHLRHPPRAFKALSSSLARSYLSVFFIGTLDPNKNRHFCLQVRNPDSFFGLPFSFLLLVSFFRDTLDASLSHQDLRKPLPFYKDPVPSKGSEKLQKLCINLEVPAGSKFSLTL